MWLAKAIRFPVVERLLVFRGDVRTVDGAGHYHGLLRVDGHHFLLDSLKNGPVWLDNPAVYYNELARTPFGLVAALPGGTPNPILGYAARLQQGAFAALQAQLHRKRQFHHLLKTEEKLALTL